MLDSAIFYVLFSHFLSSVENESGKTHGDWRSEVCIGLDSWF